MFKKIKYWFLYRFHPKHRYHVLKLDSPGYSDPRYQLILANMRIVERYMDELRANLFFAGFDGDDITLIEDYIEFNKEADDEYSLMFGHTGKSGWVEHYEKLWDVWQWWEEVKDSIHLDHDFSVEEVERFVSEENKWMYPPECYMGEVDRRLKQVIDLRKGMWT